jgi:hypothetical protein
MAQLPPRPTGSPLARQASPGEKAAALILAPLAYGEAPRAGFFGDTRVGKTYAINRLIGLYLQRSLGVVAVVDDKYPDRAQYAGQLYTDPVDLIANPMQAEPRILVFRGDARANRRAEPEQVAGYCWSLRELRRPSLLVIDELNHPLLTTNGMWCSGAEQVPRTFWQGGGAGIGCFWGAQSPQDAPRAAFEQSSCIVTFKLAGLGLRKLRELDYCDAEAAKIIPTFPGDEVPPMQRGHHVILQRGKPWNGEVYRWGV